MEKTPFEIITEFINNRTEPPQNAKDMFDKAGVSYEFFEIDTSTPENVSKKVDKLLELETELNKKLTEKETDDLQPTVTKYVLDQYLHMLVECINGVKDSCAAAEHIIKDKINSKKPTEMTNMIKNPIQYSDEWLDNWIENVYNDINPDGHFVEQLKDAFTEAKKAKAALKAGNGNEDAAEAAKAAADAVAPKETYVITVSKNGANGWIVNNVVKNEEVKGGRAKTRKNKHTRKRVRPNKRAFKNRTKSR